MSDDPNAETQDCADDRKAQTAALSRALVRNGVVSSAAVDDAEGYDGGAMLARVAAAAAELFATDRSERQARERELLERATKAEARVAILAEACALAERRRLEIDKLLSRIAELESAAAEEQKASDAAHASEAAYGQALAVVRADMEAARADCSHVREIAQWLAGQCAGHCPGIDERCRRRQTARTCIDCWLAWADRMTREGVTP